MGNGVNTTVAGSGTEADPFKVNLNDNVILGHNNNGSLDVTGTNGSAVKIDGTDGSVYMKSDNANALTMKSGTGTNLAGTSVTRITYTPEVPAGQTATPQTVATLENDGMKYGGDKGDVIQMNLNGQVNVKGGATGTLTDGNIGVVSDGQDTLTVKLANDINLGSVTTGHAKMNDDGMTITVGNPGKNSMNLDKGNVTLTDAGLDNGGNQIHHVDKGTADDDAVNVSQLHQVESNVNQKFTEVNNQINNVNKRHTEVTVNGGTAAKNDGSYTDGNLQIAQKTGTDGQKIYDLKLSDNLNIGGKDGRDGKMGIKGADGKDGVTIKGGDGENGTDGHIGINGKDGTSADIHVKNGQNGVDGTDGHGGKDGMDRVVYEDHNHVTHEVATMDDGMKYSGDSGNAAVKLNKNVQIYGGATEEYADGNNIGVVASQDGDNAKLQIKLAKDIKGINSIEANTITTGNTTIDNSGLTVKTGDSNHQNITIQQGNVNMGGNQIHNVAPGKVVQNSTDAVNGGQLWQRDQVINGLGGAVNKLGSRINRVGAGAAALAALHPLDFDPDDKWDFAAGYGNYRGANAAAVGAYYRPNEDTMFSIGGSFGGGENMVNAGVSFKLGQGNHVSTSRVAMAKEIKELRQNVASLNAIVNRQSALIDKLTGTNAGTVSDTGNDLFPDVPANHWAYEYVTKLKQAGILTGYPDGNFDGDRMMTRYEFAAIVYRAIMAGAASNPALNQDGTLDKLAKEFSPEMKYIRIDTIAKDKNDKPTIERVRVIPDVQ